jgi:hypothetical protein
MLFGSLIEQPPFGEKRDNGLGSDSAHGNDNYPHSEQYAKGSPFRRYAA